MPHDPLDHLEDSQLIERCLRGDELAFEIMFVRYRDAVYGYALRILRNRTEAEEVAVEILEKVFSTLGTFRRGAEFKPWLYAIARNGCLMRIRRSRKAEQLEMARLAAGEEALPEGEMEQEERAAAVRAQIDMLDEPYRETVILTYFQGLNSRQAAAVLGTNENTVRTRLARALRMLKERLGGV